MAWIAKGSSQTHNAASCVRCDSQLEQQDRHDGPMRVRADATPRAIRSRRGLREAVKDDCAGRTLRPLAQPRTEDAPTAMTRNPRAVTRALVRQSVDWRRDVDGRHTQRSSEKQGARQTASDSDALRPRQSSLAT